MAVSEVARAEVGAEVGAEVVPLTDAESREQRVRAAEQAMLHDVKLGMFVGIVVCVVVWIGIVLIALAGTDWDLAPVIAMSAVVGVLAGVFLRWGHRHDRGRREARRSGEPRPRWLTQPSSVGHRAANG